MSLVIEEDVQEAEITKTMTVIWFQALSEV